MSHNILNEPHRFLERDHSDPTGNLIEYKAGHFEARNNPPQDSPLLDLPIEIIKLIGKFVASGEDLDASASNLVAFGRVCAVLHQATHDSAFKEVLFFGRFANLGNILLRKAFA